MYIAHHVLNVKGIANPKSVLKAHMSPIGTPIINVSMNAMHVNINIVLMISPYTIYVYIH